MNRNERPACPDCVSEVSRRDFLKRTAALSAGAALLSAPLHGAFAAPSQSSTAETAAQRFYETLSASQQSEICLPFDHPSRTKVNANWAVTKPAIHEDFYTKEQRALLNEAFKGITSEEGYKRFQEQMEFDDGGFDRYHVALFGKPGTSQFEWLLTGRHVTLRADGNSSEKMAFGGPVVYGHGEEQAKDNIFYYQTQQANEVFRALDPKQAAKALQPTAPSETAVQLQGKQGQFAGLSLAELSVDQQQLVAGVIKTLFAPFREEDVQEVQEVLQQGGGVPGLHMAFYKQNDLNDDGEWDIWRIEGPTFVCHFRGAPHVHAYLNVGTKKA